MQKKAAIILVLILAAGIAFLYHMGCGISMFAKVSTGGGSSLHAEADIRKAVSVVRKQFRNMSGCVMTELHYCDEESQDYLDEMRTKGYSCLGDSFDDVIVLKSTFTTSKHFSSVPFDGVTQRNYGWIITHTEADGWQFRTAGYA